MVRPVTTTIDDKRLTAEFILPELAALQRKTRSELEAESTIPVINKVKNIIFKPDLLYLKKEYKNFLITMFQLVSASRELILNVIIALQTILQAMKDDDIRDMNDIYFSNLYSRSDFNGKSVYSANAWHECERGVETRRVFGVLSYVTLESNYLSKYIAGKTRLLIDGDDSHNCYSRQMTRYNTWPGRGCEFEMLKIISEFVELVGSTVI